MSPGCHNLPVSSPPWRFRPQVGICGDTSLPVVRRGFRCLRRQLGQALSRHGHGPAARGREPPHRSGPTERPTRRLRSRLMALQRSLDPPAVGCNPTLTLGIAVGIVLIEPEPVLPRCFDRLHPLHHSHSICRGAAYPRVKRRAGTPFSTLDERPCRQKRASPLPSSAILPAKFTRPTPRRAKIRKTTYPPAHDRYDAGIRAETSARPTQDERCPTAAGSGEIEGALRSCLTAPGDEKDTVTQPRILPICHEGPTRGRCATIAG